MAKRQSKKATEQSVGRSFEVADSDEPFLDGEDWSSEQSETSQSGCVAPPAVAIPETVSRYLSPMDSFDAVGELVAKKGLYFDLETVPDDSRMHLFNLDPLPEIPRDAKTDDLPSFDQLTAATVADAEAILAKIPGCPPRAWLDQLVSHETANKKRDGILKLIAKVSDRRQSVQKLHDDRRKLLSVTPEYCRIAAMSCGSWRTDSTTPTHAIGVEVIPPMDDESMNDAERKLLRQWWDMVSVACFVGGYNILHFDLRVIFMRSLILGVRPTKLLDLRPWGSDVVDVYAIRFPKGSRDGDPGKLKDLARVLGFPLPVEDVDGSKVYDLWLEDYQRVAEYCRGDVRLAMSIHNLFQGYFC